MALDFSLVTADGIFERSLFTDNPTPINEEALST